MSNVSAEQVMTAVNAVLVLGPQLVETAMNIYDRFQGEVPDLQTWDEIIADIDADLEEVRAEMRRIAPPDF